MDVLVVSPCLSFISCTLPHESTVSDLIELFSPGQGVARLDLYVKKNGRLSGGEDRLQTGAVYRLEPRLCGGKGGFGSMLRALGAQIEKTTNREACRDLSGRRLRDVNHEKEMAEWLKKQTDRDAEKEQRRLEKIRRKLAEPKRGFVDAEFDQQCQDLSERLEDSVLKGMQASSSTLVQAEDKPCRKRTAAKASAKSAPHSKKNCFWTGIEDIEDMDSTDEESEAEGFSSPSSSSASSSSVAGPSSISQPAVVSTSTARDQEKFESLDQPCSSSGSSSSACSAPCSPSPSQGSREEREESGQTDQEEGHSEMAQEEDHAETALEENEEHGVAARGKEEERAEAARGKEEERAEAARGKEEERAEAAREKEEERAETARGKEEERAEAARGKEEERAEAALEKEEERAEAALEKEEERAEAAREKEEERAEAAREKEEERAEAAREKEEERAEAAREKEEERAEAAREKEEERAEAAREKEEERGEMTQNKKENTQSVSSRQKAEKDNHVESVDPQKVQPEDADTPLDLLSVSGAEELEAVGLERLKAELMNRGLKCGGTLQERAARLFSVRGLGAGQIDPALLAKPSKGKKK